MIFCVTFSPAIDRIYHVDALGDASQVRRSAIGPGGKGMNLARNLSAFNLPVQNGLFLGGDTGDLFWQLQKKEFTNSIRFPVKGNTRLNTTITRPGRSEIHLRDINPALDPAGWRQFLNFMDSRKSSRLQLMMFCGKPLAGLRFAQLQKVLFVLKKKGIPFGLDGYEGAARSLLKEGPLIIKPNAKEFFDISGHRAGSPKSIMAGCLKLHRQGISHIFVTLADKGAYYFDGTHLFYGNVPVKLKGSAVGCGDAFLGGAVSVFISGAKADAPTLLKTALASGTAALGAELRGSIQRKKFHAYLKRVRVTSVLP